MRNLLVLFIAFLVSCAVHAQPKQLFTSGQGGYTCYRIPALVSWGEGELFAFAEGRADNCADFGNVDILMRKSVNGGKTWSAARVLVDNGDLQAGNATPVLDKTDPRFPGGRLFLFYNTGTASEYDTRMGLGRLARITSPQRIMERLGPNPLTFLLKYILMYIANSRR